jgi:hypothetical protein
VNAHSLIFEDESELEADKVIFVTGYSNMRFVPSTLLSLSRSLMRTDADFLNRETCRRIFGDEVAGKENNVWRFDPEGELKTI